MFLHELRSLLDHLDSPWVWNKDSDWLTPGWWIPSVTMEIWPKMLLGHRWRTNYKAFPTDLKSLMWEATLPRKPAWQWSGPSVIACLSAASDSFSHTSYSSACWFQHLVSFFLFFFKIKVTLWHFSRFRLARLFTILLTREQESWEVSVFVS